MAGKVVSLAGLKKLRPAWRRQGKTVAFTNGCFDLVHPGHVRYLAKAKSFGDILVVGMNSDKSVRSIKGAGRPVMAEDDRAEILCAFRSVDYVVMFDEDTPERLIRELKPEVLVKGADWKRGQIVGAREVLKSGGKVKRVTFARGYSTTGIIRGILAKYRR